MSDWLCDCWIGWLFDYQIGRPFHCLTAQQTVLEKKEDQRLTLNRLTMTPADRKLGRSNNNFASACAFHENSLKSPLQVAISLHVWLFVWLWLFDSFMVLLDRLITWLFDSSIDWLIECLNVCLFDLMIIWFFFYNIFDRLIDCWCVW